MSAVVLLHWGYYGSNAEQCSTMIPSWINSLEDICVSVVSHFCVQDAQTNSCVFMDH